MDSAAVFLALAVACAVSATKAAKRSSAWLLVVGGAWRLCERIERGAAK